MTVEQIDPKSSRYLPAWKADELVAPLPVMISALQLRSPAGAARISYLLKTRRLMVLAYSQGSGS